MVFIDNEHKERYENCLIKDGSYVDDVERNALFYILSSDENIYKRIKKLYNFKLRQIDINGFLEIRGQLNSAASKMIYFAYQLFNNFKYSDFELKDLTTLDIFAGLDKDNFEVCMYALRIRFGMQE